jgi:hypothetical protein
MVWRRPTLTVFEVLWRWTAAFSLLVLAFWRGASVEHVAPFNLAAFDNVTVLKPVEAVESIKRVFAPLAAPVFAELLWLLPLAVLVWTAAGALGRSVVLRRLEPRLRPRVTIVFAMSACRTVCLLGVFGLWGASWWAAVLWTVTGPMSRGGEPNLVLFSGVVVCSALLLFVLWAGTSWVFDLAVVVSAEHGLGFSASVRAALVQCELHIKLVETNLVMGIVRVALVVLAVVFSACPLPFQSVETQGFLTGWWIGVAFLYIVASDFFKVVRAAVYVAVSGESSREQISMTHIANSAS